eukprot:m.224593 g.224593  ORF g.224593 m.224593 type:complete len:55 (+) comp13853_c0_seq8:649-813(+)
MDLQSASLHSLQLLHEISGCCCSLIVRKQIIALDVVAYDNNNYLQFHEMKPQSF